jgi:hypothetical protein
MMKKFYPTLTLIFILFTNLLIAQAPDGFNYQALIRNSDGEILKDSEVNILIEIISGSETGSTIYVENHLTETDGNGMVHLIVGQGTTNSGDFSSIEWSLDTHFIQTSLDVTGGTNYETIAFTQLMSVPYALHSSSTGNFTGKNLEISGEGTNEDMITLKNDNFSRISAYAANDNANPVAAFVGKRSGGTVGAPTNISPEQRISGVYGSSYANGEYFVNAAMELLAGDQAGTNGVSSYIKFGTTGVGSIQRTERMRISENGNVGIGTSNPEYNLDVNGSLNAKEILLNGNAINNLDQIWGQNNDNSIFYNAANVGIGTENPNYLLDINGSLNTNELYINGELFEPYDSNNLIDLNGGGENIDLITLKNENFSRINSIVSTNTLDATNAFVGVRSGGTLDVPSNIAENQRIVGVYGKSFANGAYFVNAAIELIAGELSGTNGVSSYIKFGTTGIGSTQRAERMRISEEGNVGIGTTDPKSKLQVTDGDVYIEDAASGVIMTSPDGNCWRMTVDNNGNPVFRTINCPQ